MGIKMAAMGRGGVLTIEGHTHTAHAPDADGLENNACIFGHMVDERVAPYM